MATGPKLLTREEAVASHTGPEAGKSAYAGLFLITLATLMYEILLTRIFSVTMVYHFAFVAISVAMFGMTVGALWVYLRPGYSSHVQAKYEMARSGLFFALSVVACSFTYFAIPLIPGLNLAALAILALTYVVISTPFVFSGICVCLALTRFPRQVSKLYAADLAGAATGCILLIYTLKVTDGPTAVVVVSLFASIGAAWFAVGGNSKKLCGVAVASSAGLAIFVVVNTFLARRQEPLVRLVWVKGTREPRPLYEKWNSFSRITIEGNPNRTYNPRTEGVSSTYPAGREVRELPLTIDAGAETTLTAFNGDFAPLEHLKYDVKSFVHYLRPNSNVLVIGAGGGRDVLAALAFGQKSVRAVEINEDILKAVNSRFGDFTGHLDRDPRVTFINDEARSYIARLNEQFDIIQISFIDTWAATAAGAFTLTENSLYTLEAWKLFLERLTASGVLSVSRWYFPDLPGEAYRLTSLAARALAEEGVGSPRGHIVMVRNVRRWWSGDVLDGAGTILVSRGPFSDEDIDKIDEVARKMKFDVVLSPRFALDPTFSALASGKDLDKFTAEFPLNIAPPTDDTPFFFNLLRLRDAIHPSRWNQGNTTFNMHAVVVLASLLVVVIALSLLAIIVPLSLTTRRAPLRGAMPHFIFFAGIGLGFMFVEVSQMQRLIIFLGHPTYGLSVVLFALLLSSGLGSYSTERVGELASPGSAIVRLLLLLVALIVFGVATPHAIHAFQSSTTPVRILAAAGILFPLGVTMGTAFPLGLKLATRQSDSLTPWLWGINGATSVCASVLAVAIALNAGVSMAFWTGFGCYAIAFGVYVWASRRMAHELATRIDELRDTTVGVGTQP